METEEPMDVDTTGDFEKFDDLLEEGEYVESNRVSRKIVPNVAVSENKNENKSGTFVSVTKEKMDDKTNIIDLTKDGEKLTLREAEDLFEYFGIMEDNELAKNVRLNVLHMRGTENMSTQDVFKYFEDYGPASLEWINDISCNVVWLDKESAVKAMLGLSRKITGIKQENKRRLRSDDENEEDSEDDLIVNGKHYRDESTVHIKDIRYPLPPGIWRKGRDYMDSRNIFLRFATRTDKKHSHTEKISDHYKKHEHSNHGGLKGILTTSRKRGYKQLKEPTPPPTRESTNGIASKNPWGSLSKNWGKADFVEDDYLPKAPIEPATNVKERLGFRSYRQEEIEEDPNVIELSDESESESSSDEESWCKRNKMPRMRMHADDEEEKLQKRKGKIRHMANQKIKANSHDLRGRLTARRRLPKPAYIDPAYPDPAYPDPAYLDPVYPDPMYPDPIYPEPEYPEPEYPEPEYSDPVYPDPAIHVVVTNPKAVQSNFSKIPLTEDEDDVQEAVDPENEDEEEGEIIDDSESDGKVEYEDDEDEEVEEEEEEEEVKRGRSESEEADESSDSSSISEKEVQGPKGSVIKVVPRKPKLQSTVSTVWSRLNHSKNDKNDSSSRDRHHSKTDLRHTLNKTDLRSRIGNHHMRGRSPLRIELRNDKYHASRHSDSE